MRENEIEKKVRNWAIENEWITRKLTSPGHRNVLDRLFINTHGVTCYVEFKRPGEKPTSGQLRELNRLRDRGVPANWFDDVNKAIVWLKIHGGIKLIYSPPLRFLSPAQEDNDVSSF